MARDLDAVVVGGGFAGLSAAVRLARGGARVAVLEAKARLGGRATSFTDRESGDVIDNGQHVLLGCYRDTFTFLREIGADGNVDLQPQLAVTMIDTDGRRSRLVCPALPAPLHLIAGVFEWDALAWSDRLSVLAMRRPIRWGLASPGETVENWLIRNGQTARIREMLWAPLALAALNQPPARAAAPPFARVLGEMFSSDPRAAAIAFPATPLHAMYAEPARAYIEARGGEVRNGARAQVVIERDQVVAVEADGRRWSTPRVIVAVPWFALGDVFAPVPLAMAAIVGRSRALASSPIVTVNLWLDRPAFDEPFVGLPGRTMQWAFDKGSHVSLVSSGAEDSLQKTNDDLIATAHGELLDAIPALRSARLLRANAVREPRATFSLAPGQPVRPTAETPVRGLWLAGDWIDTGLPATIESAVRSGYRAAALASGDRVIW